MRNHKLILERVAFLLSNMVMHCGYILYFTLKCFHDRAQSSAMSMVTIVELNYSFKEGFYVHNISVQRDIPFKSYGNNVMTNETNM